MKNTASREDREGRRRRDGTEMWQSQIRKGSLSLAVLASLWDDPLDRSQICERLDRVAGIVVVEGVLYPILRRLRHAGWLRTKWVEVEAGHPRQLFWLSDSGRQNAVELSQLWAQYANGMQQVLTVLKESHAPKAYSIPIDPLYLTLVDGSGSTRQREGTDLR